MITNILSPPEPYIMDLETGISAARNNALSNRVVDPCASEAIRQRAYSLWESEGRPADRRLANWLEAETQVPPNRHISPKAIPGSPLQGPPRDTWRIPRSPTVAAEMRPGQAGYGPSPLCREAIGDDVRDYAFHLYVQSGCAPDAEAECWHEARRCLEARTPPTATQSPICRPVTSENL